MAHERDLEWPDCYNVRDLGGIRLGDGSATRVGAVLRSDSVDRLNETGWARLWDYGVRTILDLRNDEEIGSDAVQAPAGLARVRLPLDGIEDDIFWGEWGDGRHGAPLYFRPFLDRFPRRIAAVLTEIAEASPGGILFHCRLGRDRTGLISLLLLALCGAPDAEIVRDYLLTAPRLHPLLASLGESAADVEDTLARHGVTAESVVLELLASLNVSEYLRDAGMSHTTIARLRSRLCT